MKDTAQKTASREHGAAHGQGRRPGSSCAPSATVEAWVRTAVAQVVLGRLDGSLELWQEVSAALEELGCKPVRSAPSLRMLGDEEEWVEGELDKGEGSP